RGIAERALPESDVARGDVQVARQPRVAARVGMLARRVDAGSEAPAVQHRDAGADVPERDRDVDRLVRGLDRGAASGDLEPFAVDEADLLRRVLEPRRHQQGPQSDEQRTLRHPGSAVRRPDRRERGAGEYERAARRRKRGDRHPVGHAISDPTAVEADPLTAHVARFNEGVRTGDFATMLAWFTPDAEMVFEGVPVGPFVGRDAIAAAYERQPPDDEVRLLGTPRTKGDMSAADYAWAANGVRAGRMLLTERDGLIARLVVTFE